MFKKNTATYTDDQVTQAFRVLETTYQAGFISTDCLCRCLNTCGGSNKLTAEEESAIVCLLKTR